ncbi:hypothetical protein MATL_G00128670 [Megalops atlanticus]|uniref:Ig-like domain-containing protein n=1 Tax=Megalops atlanticus TaxID=7932 RepID=A0A9D3PW12_MEGAT|nr:hypothetical protein MATL_G00128670 [Megalops atlanticus]
MLWVLYLLLPAVFIVDSLSSSSIEFSSLGANASVRCQCSKSRGCYDELVRWVRISHNGSLKIIDTECKKSTCRFTSKRFNEELVQLKINQVESGDSGRYYCGEHLSSYLQFTDSGTVLQVGDVWTNSSRVLMLMEWKEKQENPDSDLSVSKRGMGTELRCVVSGLSAPWVRVLWWSTRVLRGELGHTWSSTESGRGYRVTSQLRVGVRHEYDYEYEDMYMSKRMDFDRMVEVDEEVWCEVKVGVDHLINSTKFSFLPKTETDWCSEVLYAAMTFCGLCVCFLVLFIWHCFLKPRIGSAPPVTDTSPSSMCQEDVYAGVNYAHLNFKKPPKTERQHRKADKLVYSEVRYKQDGSLHQEDASTGVNYAHLDFKKSCKTERQRRKADKLVYSEVRYKADSADHL